MNIGYSFWGYLADEKYDDNGDKVSTPDGNAFYSWTIITALQDAAHETFRLMPDRDEFYVGILGIDAFYMFAKEDRYRAYGNLREVNENTELDLVLLEWRWPIEGRNYGEGHTQPDLDIQNVILNKYAGKIIVLDIDYKMTEKDILDDRIKAVVDFGFKNEKINKV